MLPRAILVLVAPGFGQVLGAALADFQWTSIVPSRKLVYHDCYDEFKCARLTVPLDWLDETNPHTVDIAIIKLPARVPDDDPTFGGTIFTNPGGPGGSGVGQVLNSGHRFRDLVDGNRSYEILSWDPRGVALTSPKADCYEDAMARDAAVLQERDLGDLDAGADALRRQHARAQAFGQTCEQGATNGSILPFLSTPSVVRDMVEMVDRIEELRETEGSARPPRSFGASQRPMRAPEKGLPRIQYVGFSYGSFLGNTFASMYPGRVGRIIVDGIVDANDYTTGTWLTNLQDTDKTGDYFFQTCFHAAGDSCVLRRQSDTTWQDIRDRFDRLVREADARPIPLLHDKRSFIVTGHDFLAVLQNPLYNPLEAFSTAAQTFADALEGNYSLLLRSLSQQLPSLSDACAHPNQTGPSPLTQADARYGIICADGEDATRLDMSSWARYVSELTSQSRLLGAYWAGIRFACSGWRFRPGWRFTGPFATPEHDPDLVEGRPAAPLLFLSARLDPVTPLRNAFAMAAHHPGAAVVVQESVGHCAMSTPSACTARIVRDYLESGTVPESGTVCDADCEPWKPCKAMTDGLRAVNGFRLDTMNKHLPLMGWP